MPIKFKTFMFLIFCIGVITLVYPRFIERTLDYPVEPFVMNSLKSNVIDLNVPREDPLVIHFWATWCEVCKFEIPEISRLASVHQVVNVAVHSGSDDHVLNFSEKYGMPLDYLVNDESGELMQSLGAVALPTTLVIDKHNRVRFFKAGKIVANEMVDKIEYIKAD